MPTITLSATPKGNGFQATVTFPGDSVSISSAETYLTIAEALTAAALKLLDMPERLEAMDRPEPWQLGKSRPTAHLRAGNPPIRDDGPLEGKVFPLVGAAVADTPLSAGKSRQRPFWSERTDRLRRDGLKVGGEASGARHGD
jgi:hypothetical protein